MIGGTKAYYDGFYKSFYKTQAPEGMKDCLNKETTENIEHFLDVMNDPFGNMNV